MKKATLYSTGCPQCMVLKAKLDKAGIEYETVNDIDLMINKGFMQVPVLEVDGEIYNFESATKLVSEQEVI